MIHRLGVAAALVAVAASTGVAQVFRSGVETVMLSVTVTDAGSRPVTGLTVADFQVFEDGVPQEVSVFARDPKPIALSVLLDSSMSMGDKIGVAQEAAIGFTRRLGPNDVAQIIDFNRDTRIRQTFTSDVRLLEQAIRQVRVDGTTSLYTAIYVAISELTRVGAASSGETRRQAIVLLSDGEDTTSLMKYDDVAALAKRSDVAIYAIGLRDSEPSASRRFNQGDFALRTLSQMTGGRVYFVKDIKQLAGIYTQIADELANQYFVAYTSKNVKRDGAWRHVAVRISRPEIVARTRTGYFAPTRTP